MGRKAASTLLLRILCAVAVVSIFSAGSSRFVGRANASPQADRASSSSAPALTPHHSRLTNPCPRFQPGSPVTQPADLFSRNGVLKVDLDYRTIVDESDGFSSSNALQLFCFTTPDGKESPTLHVFPGDRLVIHLRN
jgi:hypothetical protein